MQNPLLQTNGRRSGCGSRVERGCAETRGPDGASHVVAALLAAGLSRGSDAQPGLRLGADQESTSAPLGPPRLDGKTRAKECPARGSNHLGMQGSTGDAERCARDRQRPTTDRPGPSRAGRPGPERSTPGRGRRRATLARSRPSAGHPSRAGRAGPPGRGGREREPGIGPRYGPGPEPNRTDARGTRTPARNARTKAQLHRRAGVSDDHRPGRTSADVGVLTARRRGRRAAKDEFMLV